MIDPTSRTYFDGEITVGSRIIDYLSSGLYHTPAACLKELINNSYDAEAERVDIFVKPDADRIIIADDGKGMTKNEFERHFKRISESHKRDDDSPLAHGRRKIGKIGIGFIAANELCEVMELYSTQAGSSELLHVVIDFSELRKPPAERRRGNSDMVKADYRGEILEAPLDVHYTQLYLKNVRGEARDILAGAMPQSGTEKVKSLYGLRPESVVRKLRDPSIRTWKEFDAYSETMLAIGLNVPVPYYQGWIPPNLLPKASEFVQRTAELDFNVFYDGSELGKSIVLWPDEKSNAALISRFDFHGEYVAATGYFYAQHGLIRPQELQGLLVRIREAAVGEYDHSFWGYASNNASLIQRWVSAEIWANDGLEEAMNIDRRTLREAHPAYVELRNAVHNHLRRVLADARSELYEKPSAERKEADSNEALATLTTLASTVASIDPIAAQNMQTALSSVLTEPKARNLLLKKYSVAEVYEIAVQVAKETLPPEYFRQFLVKLTERLGL